MVETTAVQIRGPQAIAVASAGLSDPRPGDVVVRIDWSGISTGTEKLFWSGRMPPFPGMGYPLVPGYESFGEVVEAAPATGLRPGDAVFVPGADCFADGVRGLFGGAARHLVTAPGRVCRIDGGAGAQGALLALAATARHAIAGFGTALPDLIVGHGTLGRLLARLTLAAGGPPPTVWEVDPARRAGAEEYRVIDPEDDTRRDYGAVYDASGAPGLLDRLVPRIVRGGEIVLCGFYPEPVSFAFPPAFMREMRLRVAAEWQPADLAAVRALLEAGALSLDGLITHRRPAAAAAEAYRFAFEDPACLKMILDWKDCA